MCCLSLIALPVQAGTFVTSYSGQFTKSWSKTAEDGQAKLEYGFNTAAINEDTCYAYHSNALHYASIKNGNGTHATSSKAAGKWSKLEVTHAGSTVDYSCKW